ncbi:Crp/Fnr family transcriptional regulator [Polaribacter aestuariivivens]|uniref:Crp/Fnr family transcriptional regulator n=1 Tax=Polaribacter aestuariivivens TaxID=2304626 RepID=UPI003F493199
METLLNLLDSYGEIPNTSKQKLASLVNSKKFKKKEIIAKAGEIPENVYILKSGLVRSYFTDDKGKEYIRNFITKHRAAGALGSLILNKPSRFSYDCLSDCEVYFLNFKAFKKLAKEDKSIAYLYASVLEKIFLRLEAKVYDLSVLNGTERYLKLKKEIPDIENLTPLYHIASYLNITAVQLSRIRKEIYSK